MEHQHFRLRIYLILFATVMVMGTLGFMKLEGLSLADAFYFSIVTIATVGYGDIHPVTPVGKGLAVFLIIVGVGTFLGVVANATEMVLQRREKMIRQEKMNMVIGLFISEVGTQLLRFFIACDPGLEKIRPNLIVKANWSDQNFLQAIKKLPQYDYLIDMEGIDLNALKSFLAEKKDFLVRLLENPVLLEQEVFTDLLRAVFHLAEELAYRDSFDNMPDSDVKHVQGDIKRGYSLLISQWLLYMKYLRKNYPFLFSLALRTNPFDQKASIVVK